jgi:plastocyanin
MSEYLEAVARALNAPEAIVQRSAAARAQASGTTVDEVLIAWAGGGSVAPAPDTDTAASAPEPEPAASPEQAAPSAPEATPPAPSVPPLPALVPEPGRIAAIIEDEDLEAAPVSDRLRWAAGVGGLAGAALGIVAAVAVTPLVVDRVTLVGEPGAFRPAIEVTALPVVVVGAVVSLLFGALVGVAVRTVPAWFRPELRIEGRPGMAALVGGVTGLLVGVVGAALLLNLAGQPSEADETVIQIGVRSGLLLVLFGGAVLGMITAAVVQVLAVPVGLDAASADESSAVRRRLSTGVGVPLAAFTVLALVVVSLGSLFLAYHVAAPLLAIVVAGGILAFAGLTASRPNIRLSLGELLAAAAGILSVLVLIVVVAGALGGGQATPPAGEEPEATGPGGTVTILAGEDLSFDATAWSVPTGEVMFVYEDEGDIVHTLTIEGLEDQLALRVENAGDVDRGTVALAPGEYTLYCDIRGHREAGMEGRLTVMSEPPDR